MALATKRLSQQIFQAVLDQDLVHNIEVKNNVRLNGIRTTHQIDVFWEFRCGNIKYRTVVQVKDWKGTVDQGEVMKFKAVLDDLPGQPRGIMVSRSGFQKGAHRCASASGIVLYELREPTEDDLHGRIRRLDCTLFSYHSNTTCIRLEHDETWRLSEALRLGLTEAPRLVLRFEPDESPLLDNAGNELATIKQITDACYPDGLQELAPTSVRYEFDQPTFLSTGQTDFPRLKLSAVEATIATQRIEHNSLSTLQNLSASFSKKH